MSKRYLSMGQACPGCGRIASLNDEWGCTACGYPENDDSEELEDEGAYAEDEKDD